MLYAREVPKTGGDTLFASMYAAYDALSEELKAPLEGLKALHSSRHVFCPAAAAKRGDLAGRICNPELATQDAVHLPPRQRSQGPLHQSGIYRALRRLDRRGVAPAARSSLPALGSIRIHPLLQWQEGSPASCTASRSREKLS
jgi:hypothetical protein